MRARLVLDDGVARAARGGTGWPPRGSDTLQPVGAPFLRSLRTRLDALARWQTEPTASSMLKPCVRT